MGNLHDSKEEVRAYQETVKDIIRDIAVFLTGREIKFLRKKNFNIEPRTHKTFKHDKVGIKCTFERMLNERN